MSDHMDNSNTPQMQILVEQNTLGALGQQIAALQAENDKLLTVLRKVDRLCTEALPKFNWGASFLDANAISLLNTVPGEVRAAITEDTQS